MGVIRECIAYAKHINPAVQTELQTNGLFQNDEDAIWIGENFDIVWISLDAPSSINDMYRPDANGNGRTDEIEKYLQIVSDYTKVGVRATIVDETINNQTELVTHFHNMNVKYLAFNPVINPIKRNDKEKSDVNKSSQLLFAKGFCDAYKVANNLGIEFTNSMTFNFDEPAEYSCRSCLPMPQLNPDGSVSSCDMAMFSDTKESLKVFLYGLWNPNDKLIIYDQAKIQNLQRNKRTNIVACMSCPISEYCAGGCIGRTVYQTGKLGTIVPEVCEATRYMAKHIGVGKKILCNTHP